MVSVLARRRPAPVAIAAAFAIAAIAFLIDRRSVWLDEADSAYFATLSLPAMWHALLHVDGVFALYYALLHVPRHFGDSAVALRSFSALCAVLSILPVFATANKLYGRTSAAIAVALYASNARYLYYATEIRPYAMALLFCGFAAWLFACIANDGRKRYVVAYVAAAVVAIYSHPLTALFIASQAISLWAMRPAQATIRTFARAYAAIAALAIPLAIIAYIDGPTQLDWIGKPNLSSLPRFAEGLVGPFALVVALSGLVFIAAFRDRFKQTSNTRMLLIWLLCPVVFGAAISFIEPTSIFVARYYLYVLVPIALLAARGLMVAGRRWSFACAVVLAAAVAQGLWNLDHYQGEAWRGVVSYVASNALPGEPRIVFKGMTATAYQYAFTERSGAPDNDVVYPREPVFDRHALPAPAVYNELRSAHRRVWLIVSHAVPLQEEPVLKWLLRDFSATRVRHFAGVDVVTLEPSKV